MNNRQQRMTKVKAVLLLALVAAVVLALQFGPVAAQNQTDSASNSTTSTASSSTIITVVQGDVELDYSCTGGPTGNCSVTYLSDDGGATYVRIEYRW